MSDPDRPDWAEPDDDTPDWAEPAEQAAAEPAEQAAADPVVARDPNDFDGDRPPRRELTEKVIDDTPTVTGRINMAPETVVIGDPVPDEEQRIPDVVRRGMEFVANDFRRMFMRPDERRADRERGGWRAPHSYDPAAIPVVFGQTVTGGHMDEIGAAIGSRLRGTNYEAERDDNRRREAELRERNPIGENIGTALGVASMAALPNASVAAGEAAAARGAGAVGQAVARTAGALGEGAGFGALNASGTSEHDVGSDQYASDVESGAAWGVGLSGGGQVAGEALGALSRVGTEGLRRAADRLRVRAAGGRMGDQALVQRTFPGGIEAMAATLRREGMTGPMMTTEQIAARGREVSARAGQQIGEIIDQASEPVAGAGYRAAAGGGAVDPHRLAARIRQEIVEPLQAQTTQQARAAAASVDRWLDNVQEVYGDRALTPRDLQRLKQELDEVIPYGSAAQLDRVGAGATRGARDVVRRELDASVEQAGQRIDDPALLGRLRNERQAYGASARVGDWAEREAARESSNRLVSPTDYLTGAAAGVGALSDGDLSASDLAYAGGAALVNRFVRRREHSLAATGLEGLSRALAVPGRLPRLSPAIRTALTNARTRGPAYFAATVHAATMNASPEEREAIQQAMEGGAEPSQETAP